MTKKTVFTQEMIFDLQNMGDIDFAKKWNINRITAIRYRRESGIKSFNNKHGLRPHKFVNKIEHKYCPRDGGHWSPVSQFGKGKNRYDGLRGLCKDHEKQDRLVDYKKNDRAGQARAWRKTENGRKSLRNTWRKQTAIKNGAYVKWDREDEDRAYRVFAGRCGYCGERFRFEELEFDHFIPVSAGGKTEPSNMVPCCSVCNHGIGGKFNKDPEEWIFQRFRDDPKWIIQDVKRKLLKLSAY